MLTNIQNNMTEITSPEHLVSLENKQKDILLSKYVSTILGGGVPSAFSEQFIKLSANKKFCAIIQKLILIQEKRQTEESLIANRKYLQHQIEKLAALEKDKSIIAYQAMEKQVKMKEISLNEKLKAFNIEEEKYQKLESKYDYSLLNKNHEILLSLNSVDNELIKLKPYQLIKRYKICKKLESLLDQLQQIGLIRELELEKYTLLEESKAIIENLKEEIRQNKLTLLNFKLRKGSIIEGVTNSLTKYEQLCKAEQNKLKDIEVELAISGSPDITVQEATIIKLLEKYCDNEYGLYEISQIIDQTTEFELDNDEIYDEFGFRYDGLSYDFSLEEDDNKLRQASEKKKEEARQYIDKLAGQYDKLDIVTTESLERLKQAIAIL